MLICPQCRFKNPDNNNFCQQCGTAFNHRVSPSGNDQAYLPLGQHDQGPEAVGDRLLAVVTPAPGDEAWSGKEIPERREKLLAMEATIPSMDSLYKRYQLQGELKGGPLGDSAQGIVIDTQPYRERFLDQLLSLDNDGIQPPSLDQGTASWEVGLPGAVGPYFSLDEVLGTRLPEVYDCWEDASKEVLLLEDRSSWPLVSDLWRQDDTPLLEVLFGLRDSLELWETLQPFHSCRSLLFPKNLRVDEDRVLVFCQLYTKPEAGDPPLLKDLGQAWLDLLEGSGRSDAAAVVATAKALVDCDVLTADSARDRLQMIAESLDEAGNATTATETLAKRAAANASMGISIPAPPAAPKVSAVTVGEPAVGEAPPPPDIDEMAAIAAAAGLDDDGDDDAPTVVLPMCLASLDESGRTDIGRQRDHNEDYFGLYSEVQKLEMPMGRNIRAKGLYILCDGMGGHASGEVASKLAVKTLHDYFKTNWQDSVLPSEEVIRNAIHAANDAIFEENQEDQRSGSGRMGTTLVLVLVQDSKVAVAHVGDSRLYRLSRRRGLEQLTVDHEVGQREIQRGIDPVAAYSRPDAYQLTQALGPRDSEFIEPDIRFLEFDEDTLLLMCSDGLSDNDLVEDHWQTHLAPLLSSRANLDQGVNQLIELANQHNGHDNVTAMLVRAKVQPNMEILH
ncbi:MAG: serine/threonine phosphatase [Cyanophyceae cyanobacterium]